MITIEEIADNNTSISSTRWAFATVIKFDITIILISIAVYCLFHFLGKPLNESFFYAIATLLGILTTLVSTSKVMQGFEPKKNENKKEETSKEVSSENEGK